MDGEDASVVVWVEGHGERVAGGGVESEWRAVGVVAGDEVGGGDEVYGVERGVSDDGDDVVPRRGGAVVLVVECGWEGDDFAHGWLWDSEKREPPLTPPAVWTGFADG